ncbi:flavin reductase family protein [Kitasatospora brasiliensis]|uniref:flavin reductase family protein n=1 Tax=Kitasatospora brasiliensis TaxID=3058040 RepID=UPI0029314A38|nr:flavin reductase family protein [Kitasatospora sp. K002]
MTEISPLPPIELALAPIDSTMSEMSEDSFREYCRKLSAGVAVVTTCGASGWAGTTVSTVTSVSMDPPILLCCFSLRSRTLTAIQQSRRFAIHLLADEQRDLADRFSRPPNDGARFEDLGSGVRLSHGTPVISGTLAVAWCDLRSMEEVGDHVVVYGRLTAVRIGHGRPLLWHESSYQALEEQPDLIGSTA